MLCSILSNYLIDSRFGFGPLALEWQIVQWPQDYNWLGDWQTERRNPNKNMLIIAAIGAISVDTKSGCRTVCWTTRRNKLGEH